MSTFRAVFLILILAFTGCDSVTIDKPIGQRINPSEFEEVIGKWTDSDNNILELRFSKNQELLGGNLAWNEEAQKFVCNTIVLDVRSLEGSVYLFMTEGNETMFFRIEQVNANLFRIYIPDSDSFRDAVRAGSLSGAITVKKNDHFNVRITADSKFSSVLSADDWKKYYLIDTVIEYSRIGSKK